MAETFRSVAEMFLARVASTPAAEALRHPQGSSWRSQSWREVGAEVRAFACGLRALGLEPEQRVAILSGTRFEWMLVDLAILCAGGATTTIYPSTTPEDCAYIISDSDTVMVIAENAAQVQKLVAVRAKIPKVTKVVVIEGDGGEGGWVIPLAELRAMGEKAHAAAPDAYETIAKAVAPTSLATLIYTSGTTGKPKGVELTHDNWLYEAEAIEALGILHKTDVQYLWLPLAHSFGKVLETAQIKIGFPTAIDGRVDRIVDNLGVIRPTFVAAVPRIFEKVHNRVVQQAKEGGELKHRIFKWAFEVGARTSRLAQQGRRPEGLHAIEQAIADRLVFSKLRERFGGRIKFFISGSAPLARDLAEFFHAAGILVCEGYGLTESSAASFVNRPTAYRFGTVGQPLPGTEVRFAEDGEILIRGRGIMRGYHNLGPATNETLVDGWLHTGDIGQLEPGGFLRITDRKKDLIKTSGGKYVAPQAIEGKLKVVSPWVSQVVVHGDNRNFCSALITLDEEAVRKWARDHHKVLDGTAALAADPEVRALVQAGIDELNKSLASWETIKKFAILPGELTIEAGELTPSLKVKRKVVEQKYKSLLDGFYASAKAEL
jgi:long-chain acyl-CoA synthetase